MFFLRHKAHLCSVLISDKHGAVHFYNFAKPHGAHTTRPLTKISETSYSNNQSVPQVRLGCTPLMWQSIAPPITPMLDSHSGSSVRDS